VPQTCSASVARSLKATVTLGLDEVLVVWMPEFDLKVNSSLGCAATNRCS